MYVYRWHFLTSVRQTPCLGLLVAVWVTLLSGCVSLASIEDKALSYFRQEFLNAPKSDDPVKQQEKIVVLSQLSIEQLRLLIKQGSDEVLLELVDRYLSGYQLEAPDLKAAHDLLVEQLPHSKIARTELAKLVYFKVLAHNRKDIEYWLQQSAEQGDVEAQLLLGRFYKDPAWGKVNYPQAIYWLDSAAKKGDWEAANILGMMYVQGQGTAKNHEKGLEWLSKAASAGLPSAQLYFATCLEEGIGGPAKPEQALIWYQLAAAKGEVEAMLRLGDWYFSRSLKPQKTAETQAQILSDRAIAAYWYKMAAEEGHPIAQTKLASQYASGDGLSKDLDEAAGWYQEAALQGYLPATHQMSLLYLSGAGVEQDIDQGMQWLKDAANRGYLESQYVLGSLLIKDESQMFYDEGLKWLKTAAKRGHKKAQAILSVLNVEPANPVGIY
jgi:TPR repeat protein